MIVREAEDLRQQLHACNLRATPARIAVLKLMRLTAVPMSHAEVITALGTGACDRATTHRVLNQLTAARLLRRVDAGDRVWRFIAAHASAPEPRAELICNSCGALVRLPKPQLTVEGRAPRALANGDFEIRIYGLCDDCIDNSS
jgi:Fur family transcriptional regulator, ferric uptake regulator